jgi:2-polyprenyl-6-methoxyphenol hydroxylase-like FAD-dependent oxidoreductase
VDKINIDTLIIGCGPTGLTLGIALLNQGKSVVIVDKHVKGLDYSRAILISSETLQILEKCGVKQLQQNGVHINGFSIYAADKIISSAKFDLSSRDHFHPILLPQLETEKLLIDKFLGIGGQIKRGYKFNSNQVEKFNGEFKVYLTNNIDNSEQLLIQCQWLFGCDGLHSSVRDYAGITYQKKKHNMKGYAMDATLNHWEYQSNLNLWFSTKGGGFAMRISDNKIRVVGTTKKAYDQIVSKFQIEKILWETEFDIYHFIANSYGSNHIWLAGDAVHAHSPIGGRGMNLGIADAMELSQAFETKNFSFYELNRRKIAKHWVNKNYLLTKFSISQSILAKIARFIFTLIISLAGIICGSKLAKFTFEYLTGAKVKNLS